jgi:hypothetical protein
LRHKPDEHGAETGCKGCNTTRAKKHGKRHDQRPVGQKNHLAKYTGMSFGSWTSGGGSGARAKTHAKRMNVVSDNDGMRLIDAPD